MIVPFTIGYTYILDKAGFLVDPKWLFLYNYYTMKTQQKPRKTRAHMVLFLHNTPFKPQRVELKTRYQRQEKHRNRVDLG